LRATLLGVSVAGTELRLDVAGYGGHTSNALYRVSVYAFTLIVTLPQGTLYSGYRSITLRFSASFHLLIILPLLVHYGT
jgi:hypothetical protein